MHLNFFDKVCAVLALIVAAFFMILGIPGAIRGCIHPFHGGGMNLP